MPNAWEPDYWFLKDDETVEVTLREIGKKMPINKNQLFWERSRGWRYQNSDQNPYAWKMPDAEKELTSAYTSNNQVRRGDPGSSSIAAGNERRAAYRLPPGFRKSEALFNLYGRRRAATPRW